jgi:hypothetical protein
MKTTMDLSKFRLFFIKDTPDDVNLKIFLPDTVRISQLIVDYFNEVAKRSVGKRLINSKPTRKVLTCENLADFIVAQCSLLSNYRKAMLAYDGKTLRAIKEETEFQPLFQSLLSELYNRFDGLLCNIPPNEPVSSTRFHVKPVNGSSIEAKVEIRQVVLKLNGAVKSEQGSKNSEKTGKLKRKRDGAETVDEEEDDNDSDDEDYEENPKPNKKKGKSQKPVVTYEIRPATVHIAGKADLGIFITSPSTENIQDADSFLELKAPLSEFYQKDSPQHKDQAVGQHLLLHKTKSTQQSSSSTSSSSSDPAGSFLKSVLTDGFLFYLLISRHSRSPASASTLECRITSSFHIAPLVILSLLLLLVPNHKLGTLFEESFSYDGYFSDDDKMTMENYAPGLVTSKKGRKLSGAKKRLVFPVDLGNGDNDEGDGGSCGFSGSNSGSNGGSFKTNERNGNDKKDTKENKSNAKKRRKNREEEDDKETIPFLDMNAFEELERQQAQDEKDLDFLNALQTLQKGQVSKIILSDKDAKTLNSSQLFEFLMSR